MAPLKLKFVYFLLDSLHKPEDGTTKVEEAFKESLIPHVYWNRETDENYQQRCLEYDQGDLKDDPRTVSLYMFASK